MSEIKHEDKLFDAWFSTPLTGDEPCSPCIDEDEYRFVFSAGFHSRDGEVEAICNDYSKLLEVANEMDDFLRDLQDTGITLYDGIIEQFSKFMSEA